jgi:hypothetical protein
MAQYFRTVETPVPEIQAELFTLLNEWHDRTREGKTLHWSADWVHSMPWILSAQLPRIRELRDVPMPQALWKIAEKWSKPLVIVSIPDLENWTACRPRIREALGTLPFLTPEQIRVYRFATAWRKGILTPFAACQPGMSRASGSMTYGQVLKYSQLAYGGSGYWIAHVRNIHTLEVT